MIMFDYNNKTGKELDDAIAIVAEDNKSTKTYVFIRVDENIICFKEENNYPEVMCDSPWSWKDVELEYGVHIIRMFYDIKEINITITI